MGLKEMREMKAQQASQRRSSHQQGKARTTLPGAGPEQRGHKPDRGQKAIKNSERQREEF